MSYHFPLGTFLKWTLPSVDNWLVVTLLAAASIFSTITYNILGPLTNGIVLSRSTNNFLQVKFEVPYFFSHVSKNCLIICWLCIFLIILFKIYYMHFPVWLSFFYLSSLDVSSMPFLFTLFYTFHFLAHSWKWILLLIV